jgi:hypothetical protein
MCRSRKPCLACELHGSLVRLMALEAESDMICWVLQGLVERDAGEGFPYLAGHLWVTKELVAFERRAVG